MTTYQPLLDFIEDQVKTLEASRKSITDVLPYADGQAYYQDKQRIREIDNQIASLKAQANHMMQ
jgi:hypothetical protein